MEVILRVKTFDRTIELRGHIHASGVIFVEPQENPQEVAVNLPAKCSRSVGAKIEAQLPNPPAGVIIVECSPDDLQAPAVFEKIPEIPEIPDLSELFITAGREMRPPVPPYRYRNAKRVRCVKPVRYHRRLTRGRENYVAK